MHTQPNFIVIQPEIDIISLKMLSVLGCDTTNVTFKVRRKLFGCCGESNDTSLTDSLSEIVNEDVQRSSKTWNFDFHTESPLPAGRYAWEKVRNCEVPIWYTSEDSIIQDERVYVVPRRDSEQCGESAESSNDMDMVKYKQIAKRDQENKSKSNCKRKNLVQTHIKGYGRVQKKRTHKRPCFKNHDLHFLKGPHRVANYILRNEDESTVS